MIIVLVTNNFPPALDGVGDHSFFLFNEFKRMGHSAYVICSAREEIISYGHENVFPIIKNWNKSGFRLALEKIRLLKPDSVLLQYVPYGYQRIGLPLNIPFFIKSINKMGIAVWVHFHEMFVRLTWKLRKIYFVGVIQRYLAYRMCRFATRVITSTSFYKKQLSTITKKNIEIIPIPPNFETDLIFDDSRLQDISLEVSPNGYPVVATYGLRDERRIAEVFKETFNRCGKLQFLVCGKASPESFKELGKSVYFTGYLKPDDIPYYLKTASVFFLPDYADRKGRGGSSRKSGSLAAALFCSLSVVGISGDNNGDELLGNSSVILENYYDTDAIVTSILKQIKQRHKTVGNSDKTLYWKQIANMYIDGKN